LAQATKCAVGDHLHPNGKLTGPAYDRIGHTFRSVREKEPWCEGATAVVEIAYLLGPGGARANDTPGGVNAMLTQLHHQYDVIDRESDFSRYRLLILAENQRLDPALRDKVTAFLGGGGALLLSHEAGLDEGGKSFALPGMGVDYEGPWKHESQYIEPLEPLREGVPVMVHEMYETGSAVKAQPGTTLLARVWEGYFDRDYRRFQVEQTPFAKPSAYAAATQHGKIIYFAVPIFRNYARHGYAVYRQLVSNSIQRLMPGPLVKADLPTTAQVTMTRQQGRHILHVLHYIPERRSPDLDVVEDVIPLNNVKLAARLAQRPSRAYLAPQKVNLPVEYRDGYAHVTVPVVVGHQMVVFES
jgi:hypothetical protein